MFRQGTRAASVCIGALVVPIREDGVVVSRPRQTHVCERRVSSRKLGIAIRRHCDAVEGLVVDRVGEWQWDRGCHIIPVVARVRRPWHDTAADLRYVVMICRRAAFHCVIPREGRVRIAPISRDRSGPNARRHAASEIEMHREPRSRVAVDYLNIGHAAADIAGQGQIGSSWTDAGSTAWLKFTSY